LSLTIAEACGYKWKYVTRHREELELGDMYPSKQAAAEMQTIMDETGFRERLVSIGAWGGVVDPKGE